MAGMESGACSSPCYYPCGNPDCPPCAQPSKGGAEYLPSQHQDKPKRNPGAHKISSDNLIRDKDRFLSQQLMYETSSESIGLSGQGDNIQKTQSFNRKSIFSTDCAKGSCCNAYHKNIK